MRKNTIIKGAAILMMANLITRLMGFYYRTCMVKLIGAEGMGLYQLIMPLYMLAWSITSSGLTTTISKLTAGEMAKNEYGNAKRFLHIALFISVCVSTALSLSLYFGADTVATYIIKDTRTIMPLKILSFAIPFMALGSCTRGYFMGMQKQIYPATSQVIEQITRIAAIFALSFMFIGKSLELACTAAVFGIFLGEAVSFFYTLICLKHLDHKTKKKSPSLSKRQSITLLCSMAIPLTMAKVTNSLLSTVENILIPQKLALFDAGGNALASFGSLTGMAMPLIQLPCAILTAISVTMVPAISETEARGSKRQTSKLIEKALCFTAIIGWGVALFFSSFPSEVCSVVYGDFALGELLFKLCLLCPFLYLNITLNGILNGLGCHSFIFFENIISSIINIGAIYFLIPIYGINAFICSSLLSLIISVALGIKMVSIKNPLSLSFYKDFFTPAVCAVSAYVFASFMPSPTNIINFCAASVLLGFVYLVLLIITETITLKDVLLFIPKKFSRTN